jgi:hypothetical protein
MHLEFLISENKKILSRGVSPHFNKIEQRSDSDCTGFIH